MHLKYLLIFLSTFTGTLEAARILSVFAVPMASHYAFIEPLLKELAERGHHITSITNYPQKDKVANFRDVVVKENKNLFDDYNNFTCYNIDANYYEFVDEIYRRAFQMCINIQNDRNVRQIFDTEKFDLIILEIFFSESFFGLSELFKAPIVGVSAIGAMISVDDLVGNISPTSYIPDSFVPWRDMNFWQKIVNVMLNIVEWAHYYYKYMPVQQQIYERYFPQAKLTFREAQKNFSLVLVNDHFSLSSPRPYVPNMIEVAGLNINTKPDRILPDIKQMLDNARAGVIFISLDFELPTHILKVFLDQFKTMPQIILWKTFQEIKEISANVFINSNFSKASILDHPNIKLLITIANSVSITESVYNGLPILSVVSVDNQEDYIDYVKRVGNGLSIKLHNISLRTLSKALNELLSAHYSNIAKTLQLRFRDQQTSPMERAVYWIEYVLRHNGAAHLRNKGQNISWWQFYNLDVFLVMLCLFGLMVCMAFFVVQIFLKFLWKVPNGNKKVFNQKS